MENLLFYIAIIFSIIIVVITAVIGLKSLKKEDSKNSVSFFLSSQPISKNEIISTLVATNTALALIVFWFSYLGWFYGFGVFFWLSLFWIIGLEVFAIIQKKWSSFPSPSEDGKNVKYQTIHEFVASNKGNTARKALAIVSISAFLLMMTVELTRGMRIIDFQVIENNGFNKDIIAFIIIIIAAIYASIGGLKAVIKTDKIQWAITAIALILALLVSISVIWNKDGLFGLVFYPENISFRSFFLIPSQPYFIIGSLFSWTFWFLVTMDMWQRASAARKIQIVTRKTRLILYPWFIFLTLTSVSIGVFVRIKLPEIYNLTFPAVNFLEVISKGIFSNNFLDYTIFILIFAGFVTAMISTLDTYFISTTHSIYRDFLKRNSKGEIENERFSRLTVTFITLSLVVIIYPIFILISHSLFSINTLLYLATSIPFVLLPPIFLSTGKTKSDGKPIIFAVIFGLLGTILSIFYVLWHISHSTEAEIGYWYNIMYLIPLLASVSSLFGYFTGKIISKLQN